MFENVAKGFTEAQKVLSLDEQRKMVQEACEASYAHEFIQKLEQVSTLLNFNPVCLTLPRAMIHISASEAVRLAVAKSNELPLHAALSLIPGSFSLTKQQVPSIPMPSESFKRPYREFLKREPR